MTVRIHPHLKSFIHSIVVAEMSGEKPSRWKELLMREVQAGILDRLTEIKDQNDLVKITHEETERFQKDFSLTLGLIRDTLQEVPVAILKR